MNVGLQFGWTQFCHLKHLLLHQRILSILLHPKDSTDFNIETCLKDTANPVEIAQNPLYLVGVIMFYGNLSRICVH